MIAASCAGVNFLIAAFLMLSLGKLWRDRSHNSSHNLAWRFIPLAALFAYFATLVANTVRISTALRLHRLPLETSWLSPNQLHRFEGIFIYFGFLLLLFMVSDKLSSKDASELRPHVSRRLTACGVVGLLRQSSFPLLVYYATALGIPVANGAYRQGSAFWEHSLFVLLTPMLLILPLATLRFFSLRAGRQ